MAGEHFIEIGTGTFFGAYVYEQVVPKDHFFRKLNEMLDWRKYTQKMMRWYKGRAEYGRPPFDPVVLLKMLLVAYLYNLSERQVEDYVNFTLPAKYFLGLGVDQFAPDHSTLSKFRERIILRKRELKLEQLLAEIVQTALEKGIHFGSIQVVDSTHSVADVNTTKEDNRRNRGEGPTDPDAQWGAKGKHTVQGLEGTSDKRVKFFHGYKTHVSLNAENHLITSLTVTPGNAYDGHFLQELIEKDCQQGLPVGIVSADRGYDDSQNHYWLERTGIQSAICLHTYRTHKKDANKEVWLELKASPAYQQGLDERYKIERKFGECKQQHGLGRCRYRGLERYAIQALLTAMALNLKRMVKLLYEVNFRNPSPVLA
ncbi:MAG TPA: IS5 family transposase [Candidatus Limnocylindrales bacterium]|nr:IS5 family transposase [Candidatus Limnocylindrales bacterium]